MKNDKLSGMENSSHEKTVKRYGRGRRFTVIKTANTAVSPKLVECADRVHEGNKNRTPSDTFISYG